MAVHIELDATITAGVSAMDQGGGSVLQMGDALEREVQRRFNLFSEERESRRTCFTDNPLKL